MLFCDNSIPLTVVHPRPLKHPHCVAIAMMTECFIEMQATFTNISDDCYCKCRNPLKKLWIVVVLMIHVCLFEDWLLI